MAPMSTLATLRSALDGIPDVRLAVVFGSEVRGTSRLASDIDLGVIVETAAFDLSTFTVNLERLLGRTLHVVLLDQAPPLLRSEIGRNGQVLLERTPYAWSDFRAKAMIDWWDWQPTLAMMERAVAARLREESGHGPA
jgi:predicted nucleotidyltransferase